MDQRDLSMAIARQLSTINKESGAFVAALLSNDISSEDQLNFADRMAAVAEAIKERAAVTPGLVVEGSLVNDCDTYKRLPLSGC